MPAPLGHIYIDCSANVFIFFGQVFVLKSSLWLTYATVCYVSLNTPIEINLQLVFEPLETLC